MSLSDYDEDDEQQEPEPPQPRELRAQIKALNAELAQAKEAAARTAELERENAFYKASLPSDLNEAKRKAITAIAEDTTPEAFRKAAEELGYVEPPEAAVPADDIAIHDRAAASRSQGEQGTINPANYEAEVEAAGSMEELRAVRAKYGRDQYDHVE